MLFDVELPNRLVRKKYKDGDETLDGVSTSTDLDGCVAALKALSHSDDGKWGRVDVMVGQAFTMDPDGPDDLDRCVAILDAFREWIR